MTVPPSPDRGTRAALLLVAILAALQLAAACIGSFRADDWINLEHGRWALSSAGRLAVWTRLNPFTLYRPLVDYWHGLMLALFGLRPAPMLVVLIGMLAAQSWMLARLARARGAGRPGSALAAAAVWVQPNAYSWTTLWVSNVTGSLVTTASLAVLLLHHHVVRRGGRGRTAWPGLVAAVVVFVAGALCKEDIVVLPAALAALEIARWRWLTPAERRAAVTSWLVLVVTAVLYAVFRTQVVPTPQSGGQRYHLALGPHVVANLRFFALHLAALPAFVAAIALVTWPAVFRRASWSDEPRRRALADALGAFAWAALALLLYLPIRGRPAYGYLYAPSFGIAYAVARLLALAPATAGLRARPAVFALALHAAIATLLTGAALFAVRWHEYGTIVRDAFAELDRDLPSPPRGARLLVLDTQGSETFAGRSLYSLVFDGAAASMVRLHYNRPDLDVVEHWDVDAGGREVLPAGVVMAFRTRRGRLERIGPPGVEPPPASVPAPGEAARGPGR